jgi:hypothetical protein
LLFRLQGESRFLAKAPNPKFARAPEREVRHDALSLAHQVGFEPTTPLKER